MVVKMYLVERAKDIRSDAREKALHLASRGKILRLFARGVDGIEDALEAFVRRALPHQLLPNPVRLADADVRQVPDDRAKAEARTLVQIILFRHVEEPDRFGTRRRHQPFDLFRLYLSHERF